MSTIGSWLRRWRATPIEPPERLLDKAIAEHEAIHEELRQAALRILYLQAKIEDEARGYRSALARSPHHGRLRQRAEEAERQLAPIRERARGVLQALTRSAGEIASLRRERLTARALCSPRLPSPSHGSVTAAEEQLALAEAHRELEAALSS